MRSTTSSITTRMARPGRGLTLAFASSAAAGAP